MGKKGKVGKQRKDKFYKLAKETGYRSRASFKLIQLNRKFEFLPKSRVLIDLCAAPGGWLQVAQQAMPVSSVIIGIDLVPIKSLPNVITFQEDITTDRCRQVLKKQLSTWKADVVLNDGAPNVGQNWIQDAFTQNQLTLSALKLATEFLVKGGWFITKVFRSKDYLSLVWVFKKLFKLVHVTKPQASRNESSEIFVVCQGYRAPDRIDPKFLDGSHLFKDVNQKNVETKSNLLAVTNKKQKAEGYEDESSVYSTLQASEFIFCENHLEKLSKCTQIIFDDDDIRDHKLTTDEVKECCKDIKVLGKADLKLLLGWKKQMASIVKGSEKPEEKSDDIDQEELKEEKLIESAVKEAEDLELSKLQDAKRKKKKALKERKKLHDRINLKMIIKDDDPIIEEDRDLFKLSQIKNKSELLQVEDEDNLEFNFEPPEMDADNILEYKKSFMPYDRHVEDDHRTEAEAAEKEDYFYSSDENEGSELEFESDSEAHSDEEAEVTEAILEGKRNPLMVDLVERPDRVKDTINRWFDKDDFADAEEESDLELDLLAETMEAKKKKKDAESKDGVQSTDKESISADQKNDKELKGILKTPSDKESASGKKEKRKKVRLDPEGLALGSLIVQSKKLKRDIIESAYNRYASNDENLPAWFVSDEKKHYKKQLPVTAEMVKEYKARLREINARPIKKVVEARARKKRKALRRMEKARKKAEKITEHPDMSSQEKAEQLKAIYKRALPKEDRNVTYIVAKKGVGRRVSRPQGLKGKFRVVDPRMKKDQRKEKMLFKTNKREAKKQRNQKQQRKMKKKK
ncbi:pre-rRNA 2'-O-ribose RNA methyltransferase FTSJ3 [Parasteatoda tepidariorum]|uniref:pre-rRNA 2'-O-ribose RNA methyltransferase FTSJ3 n=1 Tax=Parasteatoda tepidariorum TaxID=114398 RepID=UPI001C721D74|nr:pre-rRNA 2'-O-ribose RNA methyltransferase FTSJ3 [Parasteatoda tepidariorum]